MLESLPKSEFQIVGANGETKGTVKGVWAPDKIVVFDATANITLGDELRRRIPNGTEEAFEVLDPSFFEGTRNIPPHFQISVRKKGTFQQGTGGNHTINVSGPNARVNWNSTDNSTNTVNDNRLFADLRIAIENGVDDSSVRSEMLTAVDEMAATAENKSGFLGAYQRFISGAAEHMTVIAPFLPALAPFLG